LTPKNKPVNPGFCPLSDPGLRIWKRPSNVWRLRWSWSCWS